MQIILDPTFYLVAIPAVILLGLSKGGFAGVGTAATPLVALYLPALEAAALILPVLITQDLISLYVYRKEWDRRHLKILLPGALAGMALGWALAAHTSDNAVRITIGLIGIAFVLQIWLKSAATPQRKMGPIGGTFWATVSGFTSFMNQAGGPPFSIYILPQQLPKLVLVGTTTIFFAILNALKIVPYFMLGQFSTVNITTSIALLPLAIAANFGGIWLVRHTPEGLFYKIAYILLFTISAVLLWQGASGVFKGT